MGRGKAEKFTGNSDKVSSSLHWSGGCFKVPDCFPVVLPASFAPKTHRVCDHQPTKLSLSLPVTHPGT